MILNIILFKKFESSERDLLRFGFADLLAQLVPSYHEKSDLQEPRSPCVPHLGAGWVQTGKLGLAIHVGSGPHRLYLPGH